MSKYIVIFVIVFACCAVFVWMFARRSIPGHAESYLRIVGEINAGRLKPDGRGMIVLPPSFHGETARDVVYSDRRPGGRLFVLFPTWYGRGDDIEGYVYVRGGLRNSDFYDVIWSGKPIAFIDVASRQMLMVTSQSGDWAKVTRRLD
jgi:hypothetical protein